MVLWSWISETPELWKISTYLLSYPVYGTFVMAALSDYHYVHSLIKQKTEIGGRLSGSVV